MITRLAVLADFDALTGQIFVFAVQSLVSRASLCVCCGYWETYILCV